MPREGVGVALGAHVVTNHGSPEGPLLYTIFTKKCQKRVFGNFLVKMVPIRLTLVGRNMSPRAPPVPPNSLLRPPEYIFCSSVSCLIEIGPQEGAEVSLVAQVMHAVTYYAPPK